MEAPTLSTLHHVTEKKLNKLAQHQRKFEADKESILRDVASTNEPRARVNALLEGFKKYGIKPRSDISVANLELFVRQAKNDPSVSNALLRDWQLKLEHELDVRSNQYNYNEIFGKLAAEWIKHPNPAASVQSGRTVDSDTESETSGSFDTIGRKEMHDQRKEWESYAFVERNVDGTKIESYLNDIFSTVEQKGKVDKSPLERLRDRLRYVMDFTSDLRTPEPKDGSKPSISDNDEFRFTTDKLKSCIKGVLSSDLFAGKKREALANLQSQPEVLGELVDVLNMDLESLDEWEWDPAPVLLHMRRQLNGKYRVYMDEETHQAILLHFVGKTWAAALKNAFVSFAQSREWRHSSYRPIGKKARERRTYYLSGNRLSHQSITALRRDQYQKKYFMLQLPDSSLEDHQDYAAEDQDQDSPLATKQNLLRLVTTELLLNKKIYGEFLVVQSDFRWFGPSLPHSTIFAVLEFFGVPPKWLRFFRKFLEAPIAFAQDGPDAEGHVRKCGVPMSHVLSDAFSESVLFCLDLAVNKRTQGANIYRFHDDLWVWGQEKTCIQAWDAIREFTHVMGLNLNEEKTGTALIVSDKAKQREVPATLPHGKVKWGFLYLDSDTGHWVIDRSQVDEHIEELRRQLAACHSIFAWVQAWNSYVSRFFRNNFGDPAQCFGPRHNQMIIETFEHIQKKLFSDMGTSNVTDYLRGIMKKRFGTDDSIPDGFFYFPIERGGLGVRNPLIDAFLTSKKSFRTPEDQFEIAFEREQQDYKRFEELWQKSESEAKLVTRRYISREESDSDIAGEAFMTCEEFMRWPEDTSPWVCEMYEQLMQSPEEESIETSDESEETTTYWKWIYNLYGGDLKQRFGGDGLQLGERDLLPLGLVNTLKSEKVRWEG